MHEADQQRHELIGLVQGVPDHEALVAGAAHLFEQFSTDGPSDDTRSRFVTYLRELGMLEPPR